MHCSADWACPIRDHRATVWLPGLGWCFLGSPLSHLRISLSVYPFCLYKYSFFRFPLIWCFHIWKENPKTLAALAWNHLTRVRASYESCSCIIYPCIRMRPSYVSPLATQWEDNYFFPSLCLLSWCCDWRKHSLWLVHSWLENYLSLEKKNRGRQQAVSSCLQVSLL